MKRKKVKLENWTEILGTYIETEKNADVYSIHLNVLGNIWTLELRGSSIEWKCVKDSLLDIKEGEKIGILRTDIDSKPLLLRRYNKTMEDYV